jgi:thioredoxin 1
MGKPLEIGETEFDEVVLRSENPVLVYFWGPGCSPCRVVSPIIEELADDFDGRIGFIKINVEECPVVAGRYGVMGLPALLVLKSGQPVDTLVGLKSKERLKQMLETSL